MRHLFVYVKRLRCIWSRFTDGPLRGLFEGETWIVNAFLFIILKRVHLTCIHTQIHTHKYIYTYTYDLYINIDFRYPR